MYGQPRSQHSTAQHSTAQPITAQHSTAQHSTAQPSPAQHSTAQHSTAQHSTAQHPAALDKALITMQHRTLHLTTNGQARQPAVLMSGRHLMNLTKRCRSALVLAVAAYANSSSGFLALDLADCSSCCSFLRVPAADVQMNSHFCMCLQQMCKCTLISACACSRCADVLSFLRVPAADVQTYSHFCMCLQQMCYFTLYN